MIQRYKIEDLVIQDATGVVFKALDEETGLDVSVHRFFPYGVDGGGLNATQQAEYNDRISRYAEIKHPALASVIEGGCDPVDGMPYLVTEWIEGTSLESILESRPFSQPEALALIIPLMEVCQLLSHAVGQQGIWVETHISAITLGTGQSHRPIIFQVTPLKCFGDFSEHSNLLPLVELTARITGWHQGVPEHLSVTGLGAWLNWLYGICDSASLLETLEKLAIATGTSPPSPAATKSQSMSSPGSSTSTRPTEPNTIISRPKSAATPWLISALALVSLSVGGWFLIRANGILLTQKEESAPSAIIVKTIDTHVPEITPPPVTASEERPPPNVAPSTPTPVESSQKVSPPAPVSTKAIINKSAVPSTPVKKVKPATKPPIPPTAKPATPPSKPATPPTKPLIPAEIQVFNAADQRILQGQEGHAVVVEGTVEEVVSSSSSDTLYLVFIKNKGAASFRVGVSTKDAKGNLALAELKALIGKKVRTSGKITIENSNRPVI